MSTDDAMETIFCDLSGFRNLTQFDAPFTQLTSKCAKYLVNLPKLKFVNLAHSRFDFTADYVRKTKLLFYRFCDDGLKLLCELCDLEMLDLSETRVTGVGVRELIHMDSLVKLSINSTRVRKGFHNGISCDPRGHRFESHLNQFFLVKSNLSLEYMAF